MRKYGNCDVKRLQFLESIIHCYLVSRYYILCNMQGLVSRTGGLPYKSHGDARLFALGCKLQILVSLRVFGVRRYHICPFTYLLVLCITKFTKNALPLITEKSPIGVILSLSYTHIGLL